MRHYEGVLRDGHDVWSKNAYEKKRCSKNSVNIYMDYLRHACIDVTFSDKPPNYYELIDLRKENILNF